MKNIKIEIESVSHSIKVQHLLFMNGGTWRSQRTNQQPNSPKYTNKKYLFLDGTGELSSGTLGYHFNDIDNYDEVKVLHPKQREFLVKFLNRKMSIHKSGETAIREVLDSGIYKVKDKDFLNRLIK